MPASSRRRLFWIATACIAAVSLFLREQTLRAETSLRVLFPDVTGSVCILQTPSQRMIVIGAGRGEETFEEAGSRLPFLTRTIDLLILPDAKGTDASTLAHFLQRYDVQRALVPADDSFLDLRSVLDAKHVLSTPLAQNQALDLSDGLSLRTAPSLTSDHLPLLLTSARLRIDVPGNVAADALPKTSLRAVIHAASGTLIVARSTKSLPPSIYNLSKSGALAAAFHL